MIAVLSDKLLEQAVQERDAEHLSREYRQLRQAYYRRNQALADCPCFRYAEVERVHGKKDGKSNRRCGRCESCLAIKWLAQWTYRCNK